jgi:hypothetical protein
MSDSSPQMDSTARLIDRLKTVVAVVSLLVIGGFLVDALQRRDEVPGKQP